MAQIKPEVSSVQAPIHVHEPQAMRPAARDSPVSSPSGIVPIRGAPDAPDGDTLTLSSLGRAAAGLADAPGRAQASAGATPNDARPPRIGEPGWMEQISASATQQIAQDPQRALAAQANVAPRVALSLLA